MTNKSPSKRLLDVQKEIGAIKKDKDNPFFHSKYADINNVLEAVKPILNKHGFTVWQPIIFEECNLLQTEIVDTDSGEIVIKSRVKLPDLDDAQKMGGAITYFRRYALQSLLSLEAEDDDGNTASANSSAPRAAQAPTGNAWRKVKEENYGTCVECGSITSRAIGVSKTGKRYNVASCTKDKNHQPQFLDVDEAEFESTLSF